MHIISHNQLSLIFDFSFFLLKNNNNKLTIIPVLHIIVRINVTIVIEFELLSK